MAFAERYPEAFDGILAGAPGMSLPRAALGHPWSAQVFGAVVGAGKNKSIPLSKLAESFSETDFQLVQRAVLDACDADDGLKDGIVGAIGQCTTKKVIPQLRKRRVLGREVGQLFEQGADHGTGEVHRGAPKQPGQAALRHLSMGCGFGESRIGAGGPLACHRGHGT